MSKLSAYSAVHAIAEAFRQEFRFGKLMNTMAKNWSEWKEIVNSEISKEVKSEQKDKMERYLNFMTWLLTVPVVKDNGETTFKKRPRFKLIKSALPKGENRSAKEILKALAEGNNLRDLKLSDLEKIEVKEVNSRVGGIKPHRISQILWGVHTQIINNLGDAWTVGQLTEQEVAKAITAYHEARSARKERKKKQSENKQEKPANEPVVQDIQNEFIEEQTSVDDILEMLENKEVKSTELNNIEKIEQVHANAKGAVKGALTRRIKELA